MRRIIRQGRGRAQADAACPARAAVHGRLCALLTAAAAGLVLATAPAPALPASADAYRPDDRACAWGVLLETWVDPQRDRSVPVKIYYPVGGEGPRPVVLFSHGLGGSREGAAYIGEHLARHCYVAVHLQHPGTDESVWRQTGRSVQEALSAALLDVQALSLRFSDPAFAVAYLRGANATHAVLKGRLDLARLGMAGHSLGSFTTFAAVGGKVGSRDADHRVPAIRAGIVYSPAPPRSGTDPRVAFGDVRVPIFHFTGTADGWPSILPGTGPTPAERERPFRAIDGADQYLLVLKDGDHMVFNGRRDARPSDARHHELILRASLAFWDAYLMDSAAARAWLAAPEGLAATLGDGDRYERKDR